MKLTALILEIFAFGSFIWAAGSFFTHSDEDNSDIKIVKFFGSLSILANLYLLAVADIKGGSFFYLGLLLLFAGLVLFWWCLNVNRQKPLSFAFAHVDPTHVMQNGPYRYLRHPIYSSYTLCW